MYGGECWFYWCTLGVSVSGAGVFDEVLLAFPGFFSGLEYVVTDFFGAGLSGRWAGRIGLGLFYGVVFGAASEWWLGSCGG